MLAIKKPTLRGLFYCASFKNFKGFMLRVLCVIPSRLGSTRLPKKPLAKIGNRPMIQWTYERAKQCAELTHLVIATDSEEIAHVAQQFGAPVVMTDKNIKTGSDRVAYVAEQYPDIDVVINLQGDEPFIHQDMLRLLIKPYLEGHTPDMTTLAFPILSPQEMQDPGVVKVLLNQYGQALYFSRAPIPYYRQEGQAPVYHHMGLYAFRRDFLLHYTTLKPTPLEHIESLEQLRALEHGHNIHVNITSMRTLEVNTQEELDRAQAFAHSIVP